MDRELSEQIEALTGARVRTASGVGGGCINDTWRVDLDDGRRVFVKSNAAAPPDMFAREAEGLRALAAVGAIAVPEPVAVGDTAGGTGVLVMDWIEPGRAGPDFQRRLGRQLATLHRDSAGARCGFDHDNYLGTTRQPNPWGDDWVAFFVEHRLGHQLELAARAGLLDGATRRLGERLMARMGHLLGTAVEPMSLLHGDLWGGNYHVGPGGEPVLLDPAAYHGHREAELSMTTLFGGFDADFYAAYDEAWPLEAGWRERVELYGLYHLLNHLNLFGRSYLGRCRAILERF